MITHNILANDAIAVVEPLGSLSEEDFKKLAHAIDTYLEDHESLKGLVIRTQEFPGWEDFEGLIGHIKFVKDHHKKIQKVALVSDSKMAHIAPQIASHFVSAEVRSFDYDCNDEAMGWIRSE